MRYLHIYPYKNLTFCAFALSLVTTVIEAMYMQANTLKAAIVSHVQPVSVNNAGN